ncbi:hypothetical protein [Cellulosimicrobium protaetiae]
MKHPITSRGRHVAVVPAAPRPTGRPRLADYDHAGVVDLASYYVDLDAWYATELAIA